jgi:hypothetical protein
MTKLILVVLSGFIASSPVQAGPAMDAKIVDILINDLNAKHIRFLEREKGSDSINYQANGDTSYVTNVGRSQICRVVKKVRYTCGTELCDWDKVESTSKLGDVAMIPQSGGSIYAGRNTNVMCIDFAAKTAKGASPAVVYIETTDGRAIRVQVESYVQREANLRKRATAGGINPDQYYSTVRSCEKDCPLDLIEMEKGVESLEKMAAMMSAQNNPQAMNAMMMQMGGEIPSTGAPTNPDVSVFDTPDAAYKAKE